MDLKKLEMDVAHVKQRKIVEKFINKSCGFCGRNHMRGQCPAYGKVCTKCLKRNQFAVVCRETKGTHGVTTEANPQEYESTHTKIQDYRKDDQVV